MVWIRNYSPSYRPQNPSGRTKGQLSFLLGNSVPRSALRVPEDLGKIFTNLSWWIREAKVGH